MNIISHRQNVSTSPRPDIKTRPEAFRNAAGQVTSRLEQGKVLTSADLRRIMTDVFGGSDAEGLWLWKDAYKPTEVAQVLFLSRSITSPGPVASIGACDADEGGPALADPHAPIQGDDQLEAPFLCACRR